MKMMKFVWRWTVVSHVMLGASGWMQKYSDMMGKDSYYLAISEGGSMGASALTLYGGCNIGKKYAKGSIDKKNIKVGDIVIFNCEVPPRCLVIHRIISMNDDGTNIITKGDANKFDDLRGGLIINPLTLDDIIGKNIAQIPFIFLPCVPTVSIGKYLMNKHQTFFDR